MFMNSWLARRAGPRGDVASNLIFRKLKREKLATWYVSRHMYHGEVARRQGNEIGLLCLLPFFYCVVFLQMFFMDDLCESKYMRKNEDGTWGSKDLRHLKKLSVDLTSGEWWSGLVVWKGGSSSSCVAQWRQPHPPGFSLCWRQPGLLPWLPILGILIFKVITCG